MFQKVSLFLFSLCLFFIPTIASGQDQQGGSSAIISDDLTIDPDQNKKWREGQYPYSAKPKSMWELGIHAGHSFIAGDIEAVFPAGYGFGLHLRKAVNYVLSFRLDGWYTQSKGFDARRQNSQVMARERFYAGGSPNLAGYVESGSAIHRNNKTSIVGGSFEALLNIGNLLFHQERNKWNVYAVVGLGVNVPNADIDLLNGNSPYNFSSVTSGLDLSSKSDRREARSRLKDLLDGDYETEGGVENTVAAFGNSKKVLPHVNLGVGIARKLTQRVNLGFEYQILLADSDLYDGFELRTQFDETNNQDVPHYASIRLGINLGNFNEKTEPLYWLNPLSGALNDLAEVKARPILDLTDTDGDGIIDMLDQEIDSPDGAPVDTRGVVLDSDGDGVADYQDSEPYSAPGYDVDERGVAQIPEDPYLTEDEINQLVNQKISNIRTNWFLPMVHFDLDKYFVKPEFYGQLHHIATVMKQHPNLQVVARGHADKRNPNEYNTVLSYRRAKAVVDYLVSKYELPRQRFILQYGGEDTPLIPDLPDSHAIPKQIEMQQYLNRRVEFAIAGPDDEEMAEPEGPDAGSGTPGSSRPGPKYSGNRNSGY